MDQVVYNGDTRYPAPPVHPPPSEIGGIPTQAELDAFPRMFTWGELKEIVHTGDLERLMRNKAMQAKYDVWMSGIKVKYGSTEKYLTQARLPWFAPSASASTAKDPAGTYDLSRSPNTTATALPSDLTPSTNPSSAAHLDRGHAVDIASTAATPGRSGVASTTASGTSTPNSAGFVSLASLGAVNGKLRKNRVGGVKTSSTLSLSSLRNAVTEETDDAASDERGSAVPMHGSEGDGDVSSGSQQVDGETEGEEGQDGGETPVYLQYDPSEGLDREKYAVLPNDWPYNIPYGVRHYCVWSRVPIAHPALVGYDPAAWSKIEQDGLGGFTGITPLRPFLIAPPPTASMAPSHKPVSPVSPGAPGAPLSSREDDKGDPAAVPFTAEMVGRSKLIGKVKTEDWYAADVAYSGGEMRQWAGKEYECRGGEEVGKMVRGLWDPRGWECLWFVNPPRLQSVPGFSHFHVLARRKTPEEIDASEAFWQG